MKTTIPKLKTLVFAICTLLLSLQSYATVIASGNVQWNFNTAPTSLWYASSGGYVGGFVDYSGSFSYTPIYLDADYTSSSTYRESSFTANWDPVSGNSSGVISSVSTNPGHLDTEVGYDTLTFFDFFTDVLSFSYSYDFYGSKELSSDQLSFYVQAEIQNRDTGKLFYSDYYSADPEHPEYRSNWAEFPTSNSLITDEHGIRTFSYGTSGQFQHWSVRADALMGAADTVGVTAKLPEPSAVILLLFGMLSIAGLRIRKK